MSIDQPKDGSGTSPKIGTIEEAVAKLEEDRFCGLLPGVLFFGISDKEIFAYVKSRKIVVPDSIDGIPILKRVTKAPRPCPQN